MGQKGLTAETNLMETRFELKQELTEGEYKSSIDVILDAMARVLQKLTRRSNLPAYWQSAIAITIGISMIGYLSSILAGGVSPNVNRAMIFAGVMFFLNLVITKSVFDRAFATLQDKLLDALESNAGLSGIHGWLVAAGDIKRPLLIGLLFVAATIVFSLAYSYTIEGTVIIGQLSLLWSGFIIYAMLLFVVLPLRLSRCQFKLHVEDPVSTEVLADWSGMMNYAAYVFAFLLATGTLFSVSLSTPMSPE